ncbi:MAG TPA: glycosyltransferase [Anaeromyxobacteraceae bacterium]|nr:glycosyltransferase [Anaeromyxobacteraceae bacterium]
MRDSGAGAAARYRGARVEHWDRLAAERGKRWRAGGYYHERVARIYGHLVAPGLRVLEVGCGEGDLLASLSPSRGVGIDFSGAMLARARERHPELTFALVDAHEMALGETFDVVILSDLVNDLWDVQSVLERVRTHCTPSTRVVLNTYSRLWEQPLSAARRLGLARPMPRQNWLAVEDLENLLRLAGFEPFRRLREVLWPVATPLVASLVNRWLGKLWPIEHLALTNFIVARPAPAQAERPPPIVTVVVPARNEAGNVEAIFGRTPEMGAGTDLVFVEGNSTDDTFGAIERAIAAHPGRRARLYRQPGKGKGDAVRLGFAEARGEILMILDADLTVPPEDLPRFYAALTSGRGEFVNGVRLVYPMEDRAMRFLNLVANKLFGLAFSWLLGQTMKDTLCGTKVLWKGDYERIAANRAYFGDFDPFGDFDLLFGAARQNLRIVDMPVRYQERTYGTTNIHRFRHGLLLFRMLLFAARRLKFV